MPSRYSALSGRPARSSIRSRIRSHLTVDEVHLYKDGQPASALLLQRMGGLGDACLLGRPVLSVVAVIMRGYDVPTCVL